jgi:hypothetical protein
VFAFLSIDDLFTAGLGFDLAGATLLALGLLASPRDVVRRSATFYGGNPLDAVVFAKNRIDGLFGLTSIGLGFVCQAVAYVAVVAGAGVSTGWRPAFGAIAMAIVGVLVAVGVWLAFRRRLLLRLLAEAAHYDPAGMKRLEWRSRDFLSQCAGVLDERWTEEEATAERQREGRGSFLFVKRVFGVDSVPPSYQGEPQPPPEAFGKGPSGELNA